jgi:ATP-binding protein involved in chromosome partitioning
MSTAVTEAALTDALKTVLDPHTGKDFVSTRALKGLRIDGGDVAFQIEMGYPAKSQLPSLRKALITAARSVAGVENVSVEFVTRIVSHAVQRWRWPLKGPVWASWTPTFTAPASR